MPNCIILGVIITICSYLFTKYLFGINGPAVALLCGIIVYNFIRVYFLYKKHRFFPFTIKTLLAIIILPLIILLGKICIQYLPFYIGLIAANMITAVSFAISLVKLNLSPDVKAIIDNLLKRLRLIV